VELGFHYPIRLHAMQTETAVCHRAVSLLLRSYRAVHSKAAEETLVDQVADGQTNTHEEGTISE